jgi:transposase
MPIQLPNSKIYLSYQTTDMRKGINGLSILASDLLLKSNKEKLSTGTTFIFKGKRSDRIKILWWDGQGFCLFYKCLNRGKFTWPKNCSNDESTGLVGITKAQLSMLIEGIDWRNPTWSDPPEYMA